jgi:ABC-type multidrug transport system ATPase subunit
MQSINIAHINKTYPGKQPVVALSDIQMQVNQGELFGLIGPDGAGKTTLLRILSTLLLADSGEVTMEGMDVVTEYKAIRKIIGYMPGKFSLYQDLTVEENIEFFATLFNTTLAANYHLVKDIYVQLEPFKKRRAGKLSGGMKQKLALCCALIHRPHILLLDEPTTGVDPVSRKEFWEMLRRLKEEGITILVSTPYMDEALQCDRIAFIQHGRLGQVDTPLGIIASFKQPLLSIKGPKLYDMLQVLRKYPKTTTCFAFGDSLHLTLTEKDPDFVLVNNFLHSEGFVDCDIQEIEAGIEDCFMAYM